jgi:hypothetical protein
MQSLTRTSEIRCLSSIDLAATTPTLLPDQLRAMSIDAMNRAADPFNLFDNNPFIEHEWRIIARELHRLAATIELRFDELFAGHAPLVPYRTPLTRLPGPARR